MRKETHLFPIAKGWQGKGSKTYGAERDLNDESVLSRARAGIFHRKIISAPLFTPPVALLK